MSAPKFRPLKFGVTRVNLRDGVPGTHYLTAEQPLQPFAQSMTDRLQHWAQTKPERTFMARRVKQADGTLGDWKHITYDQAWKTARSIAQSLINRGLNAERPVVILSENSLEHALLALGCLVAGVPYVPTSPPYSLVSVDYDKLKHVLRTVTPGRGTPTQPRRRVDQDFVPVYTINSAEERKRYLLSLPSMVDAYALISQQSFLLSDQGGILENAIQLEKH